VLAELLQAARRACGAMQLLVQLVAQRQVEGLGRQLAEVANEVVVAV
jgi:hypothetical protein